MTWTAMESSAFEAGAYAEGRALLYLLFRSGEVYRYFDVPQWQYQEFWQQIPKADISGVTFGATSVTSACAGPGNEFALHLKLSRD